MQRNAYSSHCEYVLAAMLADYDNTKRDDAATKTLAARKRKARELSVFRVLRLNWQAEHLTDMISWCGQVTKPPVTTLTSDNEITSAWDQPPGTA